MGKIEKAYSTKRGTEQYKTLASRFDGLKVLSISGFGSIGKPVNIYTAQWIDKQEEDFAIGNENGEIITENVDVEVTFIVSDKYAAYPIDVRKQHDAFIEYMTSGELYIKSEYFNKEVRCICLSEYKPTTAILNRPLRQNRILGTITLHTLKRPSEV